MTDITIFNAELSTQNILPLLLAVSYYN
jgi:hypothetical protein